MWHYNHTTTLLYNLNNISSFITITPINSVHYINANCVVIIYCDGNEVHVCSPVPAPRTPGSMWNLTNTQWANQGSAAGTWHLTCSQRGNQGSRSGPQKSAARMDSIGETLSWTLFSYSLDTTTTACCSRPSLAKKRILFSAERRSRSQLLPVNEVAGRRNSWQKTI